MPQIVKFEAEEFPPAEEDDRVTSLSGPIYVEHPLGSVHYILYSLALLSEKLSPIPGGELLSAASVPILDEFESLLRPSHALSPSFSKSLSVKPNRRSVPIASRGPRKSTVSHLRIGVSEATPSCHLSIAYNCPPCRMELHCSNQLHLTVISGSHLNQFGNSG